MTADGLRRSIEEVGITATIDDAEHVPLTVRLKACATHDADVIVAAGGDGTVTAVAEAIVGTGKHLAILPLGTANLLARDLGLPLELKEWPGALANSKQRQIDAGTVNGRIFLHKVVIGSVPGIAAAREQIRDNGGLAAKLAFIGHALRRLSRARRFAVEIVPRGESPRVEMVKAVAVANNDYDEGVGRFFSRTRLDAGTLSLYVIKHLGAVRALTLSVKMLLGTWKHDDAVEIENVEAVTIRTRKRSLKVMLDGEVMTLETPLRFKVLPAALSVLVPASASPAPAPITADVQD